MRTRDAYSSGMAALLGIILALLPACQSPQSGPRSEDPMRPSGLPPRMLTGTHEVKRDDLARSLAALAPSVDAQESQQVADASIREAERLAGEYRVVRPALLHNIFVNMGWRKRGLCHHWADDLKSRLDTLQVKTIHFHRAVSRRGRLNEHSATVATAKGQPFDEGLVLDAWTYGGRLGVIRVKDARRPWRPSLR